MTTKELIEKLRDYPADADVYLRTAGKEGKMILVVDGHELDPVFQAMPPFLHGYGKRVP